MAVIPTCVRPAFFCRFSFTVVSVIGNSYFPVFKKLEKEYIVASAQNRGDSQIYCRLIGEPPPGLRFTTVGPVMEDVYLHRLRGAKLA